MRVSTVAGILLCLCSLLSSSSAQGCDVEVDLDENRQTGYQVYSFPQPISNEIYSFFPAQDSDSKTALNLFKISERGVVTTTTPIEYKIGKPNQYNLIVLRLLRGAIEGGMPFSLCITIKDTNNFSPTFPANMYHGRVMENSGPDVVVKGLENCFAEDRDTGGISSYSIGSGNEEGYFKTQMKMIGNRAFLILLTTNKRIERKDDTPEITLTVRASDGVQYGTTKIVVEILDANNHSPAFEKQGYSASVNEDTPLLTSVLRVRATDQDSGTNGGIYYFISDPSPYFAVDAITGVIKVVRQLSSNPGTETFTVTAQDRGASRNSASVVVTISITDIPNYPPPNTANPGINTRPTFTETSYSANVREDFPVGAALLVIHAVDRDPPGDNRRLRYALLGGSTFKIDSESGVVTLSNALNFEGATKQYRLTVTATDNGRPPQSTQADLTITVQDVDENRNAPKFQIQDEQQVSVVTENSSPGTQLVPVSPIARDSDQGQDGQVAYSILSGSGLAYFKINENTGAVTTDTPLDREKQKQYDLIVLARDKAVYPLYSRLYLMITVRDVDDNNPDFSQPVYQAKVPEKAPQGTFVTVIHAVDKDGQTVQYSISDHKNLFNIQSSTGLITTKQGLDPTLNQKSYLLSVVAAAGSRQSEAQVMVTVVSESDSPPTFIKSQYKATVPENLGRIESLFCLAASDAHGNAVTYSVLDSNNGQFEVDRDSGRFSVSSSLDYEVTNDYTLGVQASSGPQQTAVANVEIDVEDARDPPRFAKSLYKFIVSENAEAGTSIRGPNNADGSSDGLVIIDDDTDKSQFECSMDNFQSGDVIDYLTVRNVNGECVLVTQSPFEFSVTPKFAFEVRATDTNYRNMYASAQVELVIRDTNNHAPEFTQTSYWTSVIEDFPVGNSILKISAVDKDVGSFGEITYQLINTQDQNRFSLDSNSGILTSALSLSPKKYQLQVQASDLAASDRKTTVVDVFVSVYPKGTAFIQFDPASYSRTVVENSLKNTQIFTVVAKGPSGSIAYSIVGGNDDGAFQIDSGSGRVSSAGSLNREVQDTYNLVVRAETASPSLAAEVITTIKLSDQNDEKPKIIFDKDPKEVAIEDFAPKGSFVIKVYAVDRDIGNAGKITYSIVTSGTPFEIDSNTGEITASREIRRQEKQLWDIKVQATDGGGSKSAEAALKIHVTEGTQAPQISDRFDVPLDENEGVGSPVKDIVATKVNNYKFRILSGNKDEAFCIDHTGLISVAKPLDREETSSYNLVVSVAVGNKVKNTTVVVTLRDKNDDAPTFTKPLYTFDARENLTSGTVIGKVSASDKDSGLNGDVSYRLLYAVDANSKFTVGLKSGDISLNDELDYESIQQHVLYVKAQDAGTPSLNSIAKVLINVLDDNDVSPRFSAASYVAKVALDAAIDSQVLLVTATDLDSGDNGKVEYNITKGNEEGAFKIDQNTGVIKLQKSLTTVSADQFSLTVVAKDKGKHPRTGDCTVQLNVFLPDGPPKFVVKPVVEEVTEGVAAGGRVLVVKAATSEALTYEIVGGNEDGLFRIVPSTGEIRVTRELDYEEAREHRLRVRVMDTRDRSDQVDVVIKVKNVNDNPPRFPGDVGGFVERKVEDDFQVGDSAARLSAFDDDAGDIITYTLSSNAKPYFSIDKNGFLIAKRPRKDISSPFNFELIARDNGSPQRETKVQVRLIFVSLRPDQQPVREFVKEDQEVGSVVAIVPRYFPGGELSIVFPQSVNFSVHNSGELRMDAPLDFEDKQFYILTVREKEPSPDSRTNDVDVIINVVDINDNKPVITTSDFFGRVNTNSRPGTSAFHLKAEDNDGGLNGDVVIQLLSRGTPFAFNPIDNHLEVGASLEDKGGYNVTLVVCDRGIPRLCGDPQSLDIKTVRFPPQFSETSYKFEVFENALPGVLVGVVNASSVSNARLKFTIEQGDPEQKFAIFPTGELKVNSLLDLETQEVYNLKVRATEQILDGYNSEVDVRVTVVNANEFYPYFLPWFYSKNIAEDVGAGASVLKLEAFDSDCPSRDSCQLVFSLEENSFFKVDETSGVVSVGGTPLDYEKQRTHVLIAAVKDSGKRKNFTMQTYVKVVLENINDNPPTFQLQGSDYNIGIAEDATLNKALAAVLARDADGSKVTYRITSGNTEFFQINKDTGVLSLKKSVKGQSATQYTLTVRATDDGGLFNEIRVVLNIEDSNDNRPVFTNCPARVKVRENLKDGETVVQVSAEDTKDRGRNKEIEYKLDQSGIDFFRIDNTTGVITTVTSLDREAASTHTLIVQAEDGGHGRDVAERILSYCVMEVEVEDRNDNYPVFLTRGYYGSVFQGAQSDLSIVTVSASDADTDPNDKVKYEFISNPDDLFQIDEDTGTIRTKRSLANFKGTKQLKVKATNERPMEDATAPTRADSRTTVVQIQVTDQQPPKFSPPSYEVDVSEDADVGTEILTITATGAYPEMSYSLVKSNTEAEQKFKIDPTSGVISTASTLDYEEKKEYKLQFRAEEVKTDLYTTCFVIVKVKDVNDDSPTFKLEGYNARVPENANPNFDVIQVKADDRDADGKDKVTYELDRSSSVSTDYQFFNIDPNTGTITTTKEFDREKVAKYTINVIAKDQGTPVQSSKVGVTVDVVDENDVAPKFDERSYSASVPEDSAVGTSIRELSASDGDIGDNAKLDYFVSSGNTLQNFRMETVYGDDNYGVLVLDGKLDFETQEKYQISVTATDRRNSDTVTVNITVIDTNDNVPEFLELVYRARLAENSAFGVSVEKVTATDKDSPDIQSPLTYSILDQGQKYFKIDRETGLITTANTKLDRETEQVVSFFVEAYDGKHRGKALVIVNLTDINDNSPYFPSPPYVGYVEENKVPGTSVMVLQALDDDEGVNAEIEYSLEDDADGRFRIDPNTGLVTTLQTLEKEQTPNEFIIRVKATDKGNPSRSGSETARIVVTDGNDQSPKFDPTVYRATVPENAPPGHLVTTVSATDADKGPNAELEFTIVEGNDPYKFYIDPRTGRIHVSGVLDFDKGEKSFNLTVMVTDRGMPPKPADEPAFVYINLVDSNDNAPVFVPDEYMELVSESHPVGDPIVTVAAFDLDSGTNALFNFTITDGDIADIFDITPRSDNKSLGVITTLLPLDRESVSQYNLTIAATDTGGLQGTATVILVLTDVNDNGPWFIPPYYEGTIKAGISTKQSVTTLKAFDPDESSNGLPFTFSIVNDTDRFVLEKEQDPDSSAYMYSQGTFDRTIRAEWILRVKAEDSGSPRRSNFTNVYVDVLDDRNIHEPFDGTLSIIVNAYNGKFKGGVIGKAYYRDDDYEGDQNTYTMASQEYFTVSERTGEIQAEADIPMGGYSFNIQIVERKSRQGSSFPKTVIGRVNVLVRSVTEAAVQSSVAVQIFGLRKVSVFVGNYYDSFQALFADILSGGNTQSVLIFSIQKAPQRRLPVGALFGVEIHLAVALSGNAFMERIDIVRTLLEAKEEMEALGLAIGDIGIDECAYEFQDVGKCRNEITASSAFSVVSGDYGRVPALDSSLTIVSMDVELKGVYTSIIPKDRNCSTDNPCLHGGTCHNAVPKGIICECGREYRGPECQSTTRTFKGNTYIWLEKLEAYQRSHVSLQFITETANGLLLFQGPLYDGANNGLPDFMALLMVNGYAQLVITLGAHPSAPLVLYMNRGDKLNDKKWHTVEVIRKLKTVVLRIDKCANSEIVEDSGRVIENRENCEIEGEIWGSSIYLNGFGPLQIGGVENELKYPEISYTGFSGCIRNIYDNGIMYDLINPLKNVGTELGCKLQNNACPDCSNRGYCEPLWVDSICVCDLGYTGPTCNSRSNANYYMANSFTQYQVRQARRKRRELVPPPVAMANEFYTNIALQVKVSPLSSNVVIFLASNSLGTEFSQIDVKNHVLRYVYRLGDRMKILSIPQINITDDKYHAVIVKREGNRASLQIDYEGKVEGNTGGIHKLLNMGGGSFFTGGLPNITEVRVVQAFVNSGGNAILRTAEGQVISSGMAQGSSNFFGGAEFVGSVITIGPNGEVSEQYSGSSYEVLSSYSFRSITFETGSRRQILISGSTGAASYSALGSVITIRGSGGAVLGGGGAGGSAGGASGGAGGSSGGAGGSSGGTGGSSGGTGGSSGGTGSSSGGTGGSSGGTGGSSGGTGGSSGGTGGASGSSSGTTGGTGSGATGTLFGNAHSTGGAGSALRVYGKGMGWTLMGANEPSAPQEVQVIGDFGGCTAANSYNGVDLDSDPSIEARRQNVVFGCPCETGFCLHGGTCVNAVPPFCLCPPGWTGPRCEVVVANPAPGQRPGSRWANPAVVATIAVILLAILFIIGAVLLKRRREPVVVAVVEDGHVHDNVRPYHDEGAGEVDNFGYDISQLMKYTYVENGGLGVAGAGAGAGAAGVGGVGGGKFKRGGGAGEEEFSVAEDKPLLQGAMPGIGMQHGVTTITKRRVVHPESIDVKQFIDTRVHEADGEYILSIDELHIYRYEGDDSDVDDLSELGDSDEEPDEEEEQEFEFLQSWGKKFDNLNRIFNAED